MGLCTSWLKCLMAAGFFGDNLTCSSVEGKYFDGDISNLLSVALCLRTIAGHRRARYPLEKLSSLSLACDALRDRVMNLSSYSNKN